MKKLHIWFLAGLCCFGIALALTAFLLPVQQNRTRTAPAPQTYWLRDLEGRVAVYYTNDPTQKPLAIYDIYVNLLPQPDVIQLKAGLRVEGETELQRMLEDLGY